MKRLTVPRVLSIAAILVAITVGCSGSSGPTSPWARGDSASAVLSLGDITQSGSEISVPVLYSGLKDVRAMSLRVGFNPDGLVPVGVDWGGTAGAEDVTFQMLDQDGFVPLAVARFSTGGLSGDGVLCSLRFSVKDQNYAMPWVVSDEAYLVAVDSAGQPVRLIAGGEAR